ncbi:amino acid ABC transporter permease [Aeromicrobium endophyticum]|uniref:Amino acid ABC transporter permease n=1 Tax=Aeromicrobium endophyticum TaxID=2292704 RepID=A0A371P8H1_9ACTN|nr:amino acid ABC transporter permease [Aeromicrobium endophyticum]REK72219.1 amino acid ABC transporter permease [Aeromicrobium endophyticum]
MSTSLINDWGEWLPRLWDGLLVSLQVTGLSLVLGFVIGLGFALLSSAGSGLVRWPAILLVEIGRGMPALVMLQLVYFGLPGVGITFDAFPATVVALTLTTAAYTSEIIRAGLRAVPAGELEAADALGLSHVDAMRFVVIPQGLRIALPTLMGFAILIFQVSALAYSLGLPELLGQAYSIGAATFRYLDVLVLAGLLYLAITIPASWLVDRLERRLSKHLG